jgi:hypothetical protein
MLGLSPAHRLPPFANCCSTCGCSPAAAARKQQQQQQQQQQQLFFTSCSSLRQRTTTVGYGYEANIAGDAAATATALAIKVITPLARRVQ